MERFSMITDSEHALAAKQFRQQIANTGTSDEELDKLGQTYYNWIMQRRLHPQSSKRSTTRPELSINLPSLIQKTSLRQLTQAAFFAIVTGISGYFAYYELDNRFSEASPVMERVAVPKEKISALENTLKKTEDAILRNQILTKIDTLRKQDTADSNLLLFTIAGTAGLAGVITSFKKEKTSKA